MRLGGVAFVLVRLRVCVSLFVWMFLCVYVCALVRGCLRVCARPAPVSVTVLVMVSVMAPGGISRRHLKGHACACMCPLLRGWLSPRIA